MYQVHCGKVDIPWPFSIFLGGSDRYCGFTISANSYSIYPLEPLNFFLGFLCIYCFSCFKSEMITFTSIVNIQFRTSSFSWTESLKPPNLLVAIVHSFEESAPEKSSSSSTCTVITEKAEVF